MSDNPLATYSALRSQLNSRRLRFVKPSVIDVAHVEGSAETVGVVPPRGSVVIYCAKTRRIIDSIEQALSSNNRKKLEAVAAQIAGLLKGKTDPSRHDALKALSEVETVYDVRYFGKVIVDANGLLPGYTFSTTTVAYTGGALQTEGFVVAEYLLHERAHAYKYLVAIRPPILTKLEQAALEKLPSELSEMTIGGSVTDENEDTFKVVGDAAKEMVEREKTTWHKPDILDQLEEELQAESIDPNAAAATLMRARQELIIRSQRKLQ